MRDEAVVRTPFVHRLSLSAIGTPTSGRSRHRSRSRSMSAARASACSRVTVLNACSDGSTASSRSSAARQTSLAERARSRTAVPNLANGCRAAHPMTRGTLNSPAGPGRQVRDRARSPALPPGRARAAPRPGDRRDTARARWRSAERRACPPAALRRRRRGSRRAGARTVSISFASSSRFASAGDGDDLFAREHGRFYNVTCAIWTRMSTRSADRTGSSVSVGRGRRALVPAVADRPWLQPSMRYLARPTWRACGRRSAVDWPSSSPHAGLMYSGPVAAHAYRLLRDRRFDVAVLVGPSHFVGFDGVAVVPSGGFETPFGVAPHRCGVRRRCDGGDADCARASHPRTRASTRSRCSCPFCSVWLPTRRSSRWSWAIRRPTPPSALAEALAAVVARPARASRRQHRLVALPGRAPRPRGWTGRSSTASRASMPMGCRTRSNVRPEHACGGGPTVAVMRAARLLGARRRGRAQLCRLGRCLGRQVGGGGIHGRGVRQLRKRNHRRRNATTKARRHEEE